MDRIARILEGAREEAKRGFDRTEQELLDIDSMISAAEDDERPMRELLECTLAKRKTRLQSEREQYELELQLLRSEGFLPSCEQCVWEQLNDKNKWKKEKVLAVFRCTPPSKFPDELKESSWNDTAAESIRDDRDILLARLQKSVVGRQRDCHCVKEIVIAALDRHPEVLKQDVLPKELLDDKEVFQAYIRSPRADYGAISDLLQKFSAGIRGNADLMLDAAKTSCTVFKHFDGALLEDRSFAVRLVEAAKPSRYTYPKKIPSNALERFAERVRSDPDVVLAFVRRNGLCLKDAVESLQGDEEIVRAACANEAEAIFHCMSETTRRRLGSDRAFMQELFSGIYAGWRPFAEQRGNPELYRMLSDDLKLDREIIAAAQKCGSLSSSDLPPSLASDIVFWLDMIQQNTTFWYSLPVIYADDPVFASAIGEFEDKEMVAAVFDRFPWLAQERSIWLKIITSNSIHLCEEMPDVILERAPQHIRHDRTLMFYACTRFDDILKVLPTHLQEDREFVEAVVDLHIVERNLGDELQWIPANAQRLYPDLVVKAISHADECEHPEKVAPELWSNLEVCKAWIERAGAIPPELPEAMSNNQEFGLIAAKVHESYYAYFMDFHLFSYVTSVALRSNKTFMMKAVQIDGSLFRFSQGSLRRDFDLAVTAFGSEAFGDYAVDDCWRDDRNFFLRVLDEAKEKVKAHQGFVVGLLCGMSVSAGPDCHLPVLANDAHTSLALKRMIAAFLGAPMGKELRILRRVVEEMTKERAN